MWAAAWPPTTVEAEKVLRDLSRGLRKEPKPQSSDGTRRCLSRKSQEPPVVMLQVADKGSPSDLLPPPTVETETLLTLIPMAEEGFGQRLTGCNSHTLESRLDSHDGSV